MDTENNKKENELNVPTAAIVIFWIVVASLLFYFLILPNFSNQNNQTNPTNTNQTVSQTATDQTSQADTSGDHIYSYVSSLISVFDNLYISTQELTNVQSQYPTESQAMQQQTTMLQINTDLTDAASSLQPYINDNNSVIQATAKIIYADILTMENANGTISEDFRTATPETLNMQQVQYDIAQYASTENTLQKDLFQNKALFIITKGLIQLPVEPSQATGAIQYSISPSQRQDLINSIQQTFGTAFDNYNNNNYLLAAKVIQMSLTFDTYEEQSSYKLP